jgi:hypothetical protein
MGFETAAIPGLTAGRRRRAGQSVACYCPDEDTCLPKPTGVIHTRDRILARFDTICC